MGNFDGQLFTIANTGTATAPVFGTPVLIGGIDVGDNATPAFGDLDGDGNLDILVGHTNSPLHLFLGSHDPHIVVNVTAENDAPALTGVAPSITLPENTANAGPQLLDADVTFTDPDFGGGTLVVSGLLAEDTVSIRNQGNGAARSALRPARCRSAA